MSSGNISTEIITNKIFIIRGQKVMLDRDLAQLYGVTTKRLNEQVKRNKRRFPGDFMFRLTQAEAGELVTSRDRLNSDISSGLRSQIATSIFPFSLILLLSIIPPCRNSPSIPAIYF